ncbi:MAG: FtsX-like permease family protein [Myxococcales bacterium]|nr:FtsX-like permease family protein [Myxococcales bacterium]HRC55025.1 FtsX-like permease family protein [Kofleriaceae bacterium]
MNLATYARRNMFRRRWRTILTIVVIALTVVIFSAIRTVVVAWSAGADEAAQDRLATRHKVSITMQLPKRYIDDVRAIPGIKAASWAVWFGGKDPKKRIPFFATFAADQHTWFDVIDEMKVPAAQLAEWKTTANGAILGDVLAKTLEVKVGDRLVITSDIYPGDWEFKVVGIYEATRKSVDRNTMVFRWDFFNNDPRASFSREQIGWMMSRVSDPRKGAELSRQIDKIFDERDDQTMTMSERAFQLSFLGAFSAILKAFDWISVGILLIMALILANSIAMNVRERTHEYGVLRAVGFSAGHVRGFILGESVLIAALGGVIGVALTVVLINGLLGPVIEESMAAFFPYFRTPPSVLLMALGLALALGVAAAVLPARRASRLKVTDALRRLD